MPSTPLSEIDTPTTPLDSLYPQAFKAQNIRNIGHDLDCVLYPIYQLDQLTRVMQQKNTFIARFVVNQEGVLWFAEEGVPESNIPAHYQMCSEHASNAWCLTAGNIEFSPDYRQIIRVNHKSGDFRPSFESLAVFFSIYLRAPRIDSVALPVLLASNVQVEKLSSSNSVDDTHNFTMDDLEAWGSSINTMSPQPKQTNPICYTKPHVTRFRATPPVGHDPVPKTGKTTGVHRDNLFYSPSDDGISPPTPPSPPTFDFD